MRHPRAKRRVRKIYRRRVFKKFGRKKVVVKLTKSLSEHFPPAVRTRLTALGNIIFNNPGGAGVSNDGSVCVASIRGNGMINIGPAIGYNQGAVGAYTVNYPAGLSYLLGNPLVGGVVAGTVTAPYSRYLVLGSYINIKICPTLGDVNAVTRATLIPWTYDASSLTTTMIAGNYAEQPYAKTRLIPYQITSNNPIMITHSMTTKRMYGINKNVTTDDPQYIATYNTNPTQPWDWFLIINNCDITDTTSVKFSCDYKITYDVIFFDRTLIKSSAPA